MQTICASGGIGRLAGFRCQCSQGRAGSTPASRTKKEALAKPVLLFWVPPPLAAPPGLFHLLGASESPRHQDFCLRQKCLERRTRGGFFTDFGFDSPCQKERHSFGNVFLFGFLRLWTAPPYLFYLLGRNKSARHQDFCYAKMLDTPHSRRIFSPTSGLTLLAKLEATFWPCDAGLKCSLYF